jgi:hypothetical protein
MAKDVGPFTLELNVLTTALLLIGLYAFGLGFYRLFLHPLAKFPGPRLAALTTWYEGYFDVVKRGRFTFELGRLHKKYGECGCYFLTSAAIPVFWVELRQRPYWWLYSANAGICDEDPFDSASWLLWLNGREGSNNPTGVNRKPHPEFSNCAEQPKVSRLRAEIVADGGF